LGVDLGRGGSTSPLTLAGVTAPGYNFRFASRTTRRKADQVSSTAQTLGSTIPSGSAHARTTSSVTVVGTPALFFGHEIQRQNENERLIRSRMHDFADKNLVCLLNPEPCFLSCHRRSLA
jgi:hypothetical protein